MSVGQRAVAWHGWEWMPGMCARDVDGDIGIVVHIVGQRLRLHYGAAGSGRSWDEFLAWQVAHESTPALKHPATQGCCIALIAKHNERKSIVDARRFVRGGDRRDHGGVPDSLNFLGIDPRPTTTTRTGAALGRCGCQLPGQHTNK